MPAKKKANKRPGRAGRIALGSLAGLALLLALALGAGAVNAATVRVRRAEVKLADLPPEFDGVKLLYASDIDLCGLNTAARAADLFVRLRDLRPDALILGGDYTSDSLLAILNRSGDSDAADPGTLRQRAEFIQSLRDFQAPLGKFAIRAPEDPEPQALALALRDAGVTPLFDEVAPIQSGGATLYLAGLAGEAEPVARAAAAASREDCVIALAPSPALIPRIVTNEAPGGGPWCDLLLAGHTHGGQIRLFGVSVLALNGVERDYLRGWRVENGVPMLTTSGVGCEGANIRLGSEAEVWLITLRRADGVVLPDLG